MNLFDYTEKRLGKTYDPAKDGQRLGKQLAAVLALMRDGQWRTLRQISDATGYPEASVSARLREIKGLGHGMTGERIGTSGTWRYRVEVKT